MVVLLILGLALCIRLILEVACIYNIYISVLERRCVIRSPLKCECPIALEGLKLQAPPPSRLKYSFRHGRQACPGDHSHRFPGLRQDHSAEPHPSLAGPRPPLCDHRERVRRCGCGREADLHCCGGQQRG